MKWTDRQRGVYEILTRLVELAPMNTIGRKVPSWGEMLSPMDESPGPWAGHAGQMTHQDMLFIVAEQIIGNK